MAEIEKIRWFTHPDLDPKDLSGKLIERISNTPGVIKPVAVLPDFHYKRGAEVPIGISVATKNTIIPSLIGVPNCGMAVLVTDLTTENTMPEQIDTIFRRLTSSVPGKPWAKPQLSCKEMIEAVRGGAMWGLRRFSLPLSWLGRIEKRGTFLSRSVSVREVKKILPPTAISWGRQCLGVLGGGNHFLELHSVSRVENRALAEQLGLREKQLVFIIHTDSLKMGSQTHLHYSARGELKQKPVKYMAMLLMQLWWHFLRDWSWRDWPMRWKTYIYRRNLGGLPADSAEGRRFLTAFALAGNFGFVNRLAIIRKVIDICEGVLGREMRASLLFDPSHDMVAEEDVGGRQFVLHRNGTNIALPKAKWTHGPLNVTGQPVLVPGALGTESYIGCADEGVKNTYWTVNHGVGRLLDKHVGEARVSEEEAGRILKDQQLKLYRSGRGRIAGQVSSNFKSIGRVMQIMKQHRLVQPVARTKPIASLKG
jgi:tRNA-splicing ligase RtcB